MSENENCGTCLDRDRCKYKTGDNRDCCPAYKPSYLPIPTAGDKISEAEFLNDTIDTLRAEHCEVDGELSENRIKLTACQKELAKAKEIEIDLNNTIGFMQPVLDVYKKELAEAKNQLECIDAHIEALVDPTIVAEIGADNNGERPLQLRVMRIFMFLDSSVQSNLEKDKEIARLKSATGIDDNGNLIRTEFA